jgi:predicted ATPase
MRHQRLESVVVEGFTSIRSAALTLQDLNVLVGANGAGKSNFIRALSLLGRIVDGELGLFAGLSGGANSLLSIDPTAPRRIRLEVIKTIDGPLVVMDTGLDMIRQHCPHTDDWLRQIEARLLT